MDIEYLFSEILLVIKNLLGYNQVMTSFRNAR